jgi:hypothetical protein
MGKLTQTRQCEVPGKECINSFYADAKPHTNSTGQAQAASTTTRLNL